ncbi:MAG: hypothetical protein IKZ07_00490 [Akkermansia sp.]|nr:hypothetical protein [Akkermansia sp.]
MSDEPEDYNAFGKWDAVGAAAMLGVFPAALNFVFNKHEISGTLLAIPVIAAVAVYIIGIVVDGKALGRIVNYTGIVLTIVYAVMAWFMWREAVDVLFPSTDSAQQQGTTAEPAKAAGAQ